jgi:threonine synthase
MNGKVTMLECYSCGRKIPPAFPAYRCECGGNLAARYDLETIGKSFRRPDDAALLRKGHFAYLDLLPHGERGAAAFRQTIGGSPLVSRPDMASDLGLKALLLKDDTRLPSASFKDRASSVLLAMAAEAGVETVCTASTGNAGCSMACLCADAGMKAVVFVPRTAPKAKVAQLLFYGATVVQVEGTYDHAFDLCWAISQETGWLNRSTGWNPFTREGKKTVSFEIAHQMGWTVPDLVFVPVGDGNIIAGVWKGFEELAGAGIVDRMPRIVAVQSTLSNAVSHAVARARAGTPVACSVEPVSATTRADSISVDLPRDGVAAVRAVLETGGDVVEVSDEEILEAIPFLSSRAGIFSEPAGATAFAGIRKWARRTSGTAGLTACCLVTGNGLKDPQAASHLLSPALVVPPDKAIAMQKLGL